ncbi:hypothetical protein EKO27_g10582 [Xylaria grammica]|uniref:DUF4139 domain-containing protein n=1 Tax=Xylaria grammica TaxID=363999 RepID=A0A439CQU2_9PEZI|nr:hypothetical protein EKO27_g10582 [Xylaria grammica]
MAFGSLVDNASRSSPEPVTDASININHRCKYHARRLPTRSVTLFPTSAQVVRDIKNVSLKTGTNQILIVGLTPTLDEHSVKIEGTGYATITDLAVNLLPNKENFDDVFPEVDDLGNKSDDLDTNPSEQDDEDPQLQAALDEMRQLSVEDKMAQETVNSAVNRLQILDAYGRSIAAGKEGHAATPFQDGLAIYREERESIFNDHLEGEAEVQAITKKIASQQKVIDNLRKRADKDRAQAHAARDKQREKQRRKEREQAKESKRVRKEREMYWPKKAHVITVNIYVKAASDDGETLAQDDTGVNTCDLTLSYVTTHAFWSPIYDMALSTTSNSAVLSFDARLTNQTSETWDKCKIVLSTSQPDLSALSDSAPALVPWRISLAWKDQTRVTPGITYSDEEMKVRPARAPATRLQRQEMFGVERPVAQHNQDRQAQPQRPDPVPAHQDESTSTKPLNSSAFGQPAHNSATASLFGYTGTTSSFAAQKQSVGGGGLFGQTHSAAAKKVSLFDASLRPQASTAKAGVSTRAQLSDGANRAAFHADDFGTPALSQPDPEFQRSGLEEAGPATTYILEGLKSLSPSSAASRHRVGCITYSDVVFSRVVVAKHKQVVFLKAAVRNDSKLVLPKGQTGLTLDGSFLGRAALPHCPTGDTFTLGLGIDRLIQVIYPKPEVKPISDSMSFSRESGTLFARTMTLVNTQDETQGNPVQVIVLDQIPVTEDERIKIALVKPDDLMANGPGVSTGESGDDKEEWGKAEAKLKRGGEVEWAVTVNPGCSAKLSLEYSCVVPGGSEAINARDAYVV